MTYRIDGLDPQPFRHLYGLAEEELARMKIIRMAVTEKPGFPCRIRLADADPGETMLLLNHLSQHADTPYRASHAIFVTEGAQEAASFVDTMPPALDSRILSLRAFDDAGMMTDAAIAGPGEAAAAIRRLFAAREAAYIHAHNAIRGCFAARVDRT